MALIIICGVGGGTKIGVKSKIVEVSTEVKVNSIEEVLTRVLLNGLENAEDIANGDGTNKVATTRGLKAKLDI